MAELVRAESGHLRYGFAGDVVNSSVYLKRTFRDVDCQLFTVIGSDELSQEMLQFFSKETLSVESVFRSSSKLPGIYWISTDNFGERNFSYWRGESAARDIIYYFNDELLKQFSSADWFYFSGISLAIIPEIQRPNFFRFLKQLKELGVRIAFDTNYRRSLWKTRREAEAAYDQALLGTDLLLASIDDFWHLYEQRESIGILSFLSEYKISEIIIKDGARDVICMNENRLSRFPVAEVDQVVDTTAAGDSFNGAYLGARIHQRSVEESVKLGSACAAYVIQHKGAIIDSEAFSRFVSQVS